jgi:hypothetical protein
MKRESVPPPGIEHRSCSQNSVSISHHREEKHAKFQSRNLKRRDHFEDLDVDGRIMSENLLQP